MGFLVTEDTVIGSRLRWLHGSVAATAAIVSLAAAPAHADMGLAPQGNTYGSIEGGFLHQDSDGIIGHGINTAPGVIVDTTVSPDSGWFAGAMIGFKTQPTIGGFTRIEFYGLYGRTDDDASITAPPAVGAALKNVDGTQLVELGTGGFTNSERRSFEGGMRFERDQTLDSARTVTWSLAPFIRWTSENTDTHVTGCCDLRRQGDVDTLMYGVSFSAEPEFKLQPGVSLVGRVGVGIYGYDADGTFTSSDTLNGFFAARLSDDERGIGFRGLLGVGLKFQLGSNSNIETFAEADYFSHVGTARMPNNQPGDTTAASTGTTDLWELRGGARLTIGLD